MIYRNWRIWTVAALTALGGGSAAAQTADTLTVDRVVIVMRHGVRPPTKTPAMPVKYAANEWPKWSVAPGYLTRHGAEAVAALGAADRAAYAGTALFAGGKCPDAAIIADSDQRTIATAQAYAKALAPGCTIPIDHKPQDVADPRFSAIETGLGALDPAIAKAAIDRAVGPGGIAAVETKMRPLLRRLDLILCATQSACGVSSEPSGLTPPAPRSRPKLTGALDRASTASQILLLEYADGMDPSFVGWGRAGAGDVTALSAFHALEFQLLARPRPVAAANLAGLMPAISQAMAGKGPRLVMISAHDTNVANIGGLLGIHWRVPGFAQDDPAPGGGVLIERLVDAKGNAYIRARYRSQTLEQLRGAQAPTYREILPIAGCTALGVAGLCTPAQFQAAMSGK